MGHGQRLGAHQLGEFGLAVGGQRPGQIGTAQVGQPGGIGIVLTHGQRNGQRPAQGMHHRRLQRRGQRIIPVSGPDPVDQMHTLGARGRAGDKTRRGAAEPPPRANA